MTPQQSNRRKFLGFLAASPVIAQAWALDALQRTAAPPGSAADVLSVMDFEELARPKLPPAHWGYMATGVDDDLTLKANIAAYKDIELRVRRLVDVSKIDFRTELFGTTFDSPIFLCPVGGHRMFHPEGEIATARASKASNTMQVLSTQTSIAVEDVAKARGTPPWYQLYMPVKWEDTEKLVKRVEAAAKAADHVHPAVHGGSIELFVRLGEWRRFGPRRLREAGRRIQEKEQGTAEGRDTSPRDPRHTHSP